MFTLLRGELWPRIPKPLRWLWFVSLLCYRARGSNLQDSRELCHVLRRLDGVQCWTESTEGKLPLGQWKQHREPWTVRESSQRLKYKKSSLYLLLIEPKAWYIFSIAKGFLPLGEGA